MDQETLSAYDAKAASFAQDWHDQPAPSDLHAVVKRYFRPGATADIGCGSGREVAWLAAEDFAATGYDASSGLLQQARARYPRLAFAFAALPELKGIADASFDNVLCETVIMHLPKAQIAPAVARMLEILKPGGIFYLSWRAAQGADQRDGQRRLYSAFDATVVTSLLSDILFEEEAVSASSGKTVHRVVARKPV
jgi:SAM-dependent methyltransferase